MTSRKDRDAAHRRAVEAEKRGIREGMRKADGPIFLEEWSREHRNNGDYAAFDALQEMRGEIQEHNRAQSKPSKARMFKGNSPATGGNSRKANVTASRSVTRNARAG